MMKTVGFNKLNFERSMPPQTGDEVWSEMQQNSERFIEKVIKGFRNPTPFELNFVETLAGKANRITECLASDQEARRMAAKLMWREFDRIFCEGECGFAAVHVIDKRWHTSDLQTDVNIGSMFNAIAPMLSQVSPNYHAVAELQAFTNMKHDLGGNLLALHAHCLVWNCKPLPIENVLANWSDKFHSGTKAPGLVIDRVRPSQIDLLRVVRYPLKAAYRCKTRYISKSGKENMHESEKGDRFIRYNRLFEILSMINLRRLFLAGGQGEDILEMVGAGMRDWAAANVGGPLFDVSSIPERWTKLRQARAAQQHTRFKPPVISL